MTGTNHSTDLENIFPGQGEMAALMRSHDWSKTPLGSVDQWPQSLRTTVSILLSSRYPMFVFWGENLIKLYNDAYRPVLGGKHPWALGQSGPIIWPEIWPTIGPMVEQVIHNGEATWSDNLLLVMQRSGYIEETYFTFSYSPVRDETGGVGGLFCACTETTPQVLSDRRLQTLRDLAAQAGHAKTVDAACQTAIAILAKNAADLPFALLYLLDAAEQTANLVGSTGLEPDDGLSPAAIALRTPTSAHPWPLATVLASNTAIQVNGIADWLGERVVGPWPEPPSTALVLPLASPGQEKATGFLIAGVSSRRALDDSYQGFLELTARQIATAIADARAHEAERQRAEALAEIDRAKTVFFSNISHEFRTPLTLMLSPAEDALADTEQPLPATQRDRLATIVRNGHRLQKLVNTLLDFSRIEAGRIQALYEPNDLATLTADLASTFRSLIEQAGLTYVVDCPPLTEAIYIDREMWEKIVLNLLSNAFKFTLGGTISVRLQEYSDHVELAIADTGAGIPLDEIPHLFTRFHRIRGIQGRSFEGSGIGFSLVKELVKLHGGSISVDSRSGQGTCLTVSIPKGFAHLPAEQVKQFCPVPYPVIVTHPIAYVEEAWGWLPNHEQPYPDETQALLAGPAPVALFNRATADRKRVLVVDDNADMRTYICRLLAPYYTVETAADGLDALQMIASVRPDLVLADVMMPQLDGFELLKNLRAEPKTQDLPVILLSARAGQDARIEGLEVGADDYLIKPFASRELLARIEGTLKIAEIRHKAAIREQVLHLAANQAQEERLQTLVRLSDLLEKMSDGFIELDRHWQITHLNQAVENLSHGKARQQILGNVLWDVLPHFRGSEMEQNLRRAMAERIPLQFEYCDERDRPHTDLWLDIHVYPSDAGLALFIRDITPLKRAIFELQEQKDILQLFLQYVPSGAAMFDRQMRYIAVSQRWVEDYGLGSVEAILGRSHYDVFPEIPDRWKRIHQRCLAGVTERCDEDCFVREDGRIQWIRWEVLPWYQSDHEIGGVIVFSEDISEKRQRILDLQESQRQLQEKLAEIETIYQSAPIGLNVLDLDLRYVRINQILADMNGLPVEAHLGRTVREVLPDLADVAEPLLHRILETGEPLLNVEITGETPAQPGKKRTWLESFIPLRSGDRIIGISTVCKEITERKQLEAERNLAEAALQENQALLQSFLDNIPLIFFFTKDLEGKYLLVNKQVERLTPHSKDEIIGKTDVEIYSEEMAQQFLATDQQVLAAQAPISYEEDFPVDGEMRTFATTKLPLYRSTGELFAICVMSTDITARKHAEIALQTLNQELEQRVAARTAELQQLTDRLQQELAYRVQIESELRESEMRYRAIIQDQTDLVTRFSLDGILLFVNEAYCTYFNTTPEEIIGQSYIPFIYEADRDGVDQSIHALNADNPIFIIENRVVNGKGEVRWVQWLNRLLFDAEGHPVEYQAVGRDVTALRQAQQALHQSEEQRRLAIDLTRLGFWDFDLVTGDLAWNDNHFLLLGLVPGSQTPSYDAWENRVHPEDIKRVKQAFQQALDTRTTYEAEYRVVHLDGSEHWLLARGQAIYDDQGKPIRALGVCLYQFRKYLRQIGHLE